MIIYTISALGADETVFQEIDFKYPTHHLDWISPEKNEGIEAYAKRLSEKINTQKKFALVGVSFGGLIATEIAKVLNPEKTILISSASKRDELNGFFRLLGKLGILKLFPPAFFKPPKKIVKFFFSTNRTDVLYPILDKTNSKFAKWSILQLVSWKNKMVPESIVKVNGISDRLIGASGKSETYLVKNGGHFMVVDKAEEISIVLNKILLKNIP